MMIDKPTLNKAKKKLENNLDTGVRCPCCNQWAQRYRYAFHSGMARVLLFIFNQYKSGKVEKYDYFHIENALVQSNIKMKGYHGKLKYWGMIKEEENTEECKSRSGYWKITKKGRMFVRGKLTVPKAVYLYNNQAHGFDTSELIDIEKSLGKKFNYSKLIKGIW